MESTKTIRRSNMNRKKAAKEPYEAYGLPPSAEKGGMFVDFNQAYKEAPTKVPKKRVIIKRKKK